MPVPAAVFWGAVTAASLLIPVVSPNLDDRPGATNPSSETFVTPRLMNALSVVGVLLGIAASGLTVWQYVKRRR